VELSVLLNGIEFSTTELLDGIEEGLTSASACGKHTEDEPGKSWRHKEIKLTLSAASP
jgi:hypothetical protein